MKSLKPQRALLKIWRIAVSAAMLLPAFVVALLFRAGTAAWFVGVGVWLAVFLALYLFYLPLLFSRLSYVVSSGRVTRRSGFVYHNTRSFPVSGIQYVSCARNPFDRLFGLCTVVLVVAGGRMFLPGLAKEDAEALTKLIARVE